MDFREHRCLLTEWASRKGDAGVRQYWESTNSVSIDGLPALPPG
ncbi:MAG: hypothetical protein ABSA14_03220 [Acidimicrobiales bacterium]|jgi:hypothetical protein